MAITISVIINTFNEEANIERAIASIRWADEIIVVDDGSNDKTLQILTKLKNENPQLKIFKHKGVGFVEPARNFAISKASGEWMLILDADEEVQQSLAKKLQEIVDKMTQIDYFRVPRKNLIFNHFMKYTGWWPDYNIRFFRKGKVKWVNQIHRPPEVFGQGLDLPAEEQNAIIHHNYKTIAQFISRMNRYTDIQANEINESGYKFDWKDLFDKPLNEFLSRFFASQGYKDGLHGLALSLLQAVSFLVVYLKLWELDKFSEQIVDLTEVENQKIKSNQAINYWFEQSHKQSFFKRMLRKIK